MKKRIGLLILLMAAVFVLAGCGGTGGDSKDSGDKTETLSADTLKTIGDVIALEKEDVQSAVGEGKVVYAFKKDGTYYRVIADIPEETEKAYIDIDVLKEGYEEKQNELVAPLEVKKVENLSEEILGPEELKALSGKTGQELVAEGWTYQGSYDLDSMEVYMDYGPFSYTVVFDGSAEGADPDNYDVEAATKDMKVKSVEFSSIGDATTLGE